MTDVWCGGDANRAPDSLFPGIPRETSTIIQKSTTLTHERISSVDTATTTCADDESAKALPRTESSKQPALLLTAGSANCNASETTCCSFASLQRLEELGRSQSCCEEELEGRGMGKMTGAAGDNSLSPRRRGPTGACGEAGDAAAGKRPAAGCDPTRSFGGVEPQVSCASTRLPAASSVASTGGALTSVASPATVDVETALNVETALSKGCSAWEAIEFEIEQEERNSSGSEAGAEGGTGGREATRGGAGDDARPASAGKRAAAGEFASPDALPRSHHTTTCPRVAMQGTPASSQRI